LQCTEQARRFDAAPQNAVAANQQHMFDRSGASADVAAPSSSVAESPASPVPVLFLKGKLVKVDCANSGATLTIAAGRVNWTFSVAERKKLLLIGTDSFACDWHNVPVAVNYRKTGENQGNLLSLEVQ
jgi:hypothetical protein